MISLEPFQSAAHRVVNADDLLAALMPALPWEAPLLPLAADLLTSHSGQLNDHMRSIVSASWLRTPGTPNNIFLPELDRF
jgi:hypothetical protein